MIECFKCKHFNEFGTGCKAFPEGIPYEIAEGIEKHHEVKKGQVGDYVFEEEKDEDQKE